MAHSSRSMFLVGARAMWREGVWLVSVGSNSRLLSSTSLGLATASSAAQRCPPSPSVTLMASPSRSRSTLTACLASSSLKARVVATLGV